MRSNIRCVIDTNVLVSSLLLKNSVPFQVVEMLFYEGKLLRSESTTQELGTVLQRKKLIKYITQNERSAFMTKFLIKSELVNINETITICRDVKDNQFLELAVSGEANFIITGDNDLLILNSFRNIEIVTPQIFLGRFS